jgi:serine/threonine protein kinase
MWNGTITPADIINRHQVRNKYTKNFDLLNGSSHYGTVFKGTAASVKSFVNRLKPLTPYHTYFPGWARLGVDYKHAVIKVIHKPEYLDWKTFVTSVERESLIQYGANNQSPGMTAVPLFSAVDVTSGVGIIISEYLVIKSLAKVGKEYLKRHAQSIYHDIDSRFRNLWQAGILHMDAHSNNIFIASDGRLVVLDFGASVMLPENLEDLMKKSLGDFPDQPLYVIWDWFNVQAGFKLKIMDVEKLIYDRMFKYAAPNHRKGNADWIMMKRYHTLFTPIIGSSSSTRFSMSPSTSKRPFWKRWLNKIGPRRKKKQPVHFPSIVHTPST